MIFILTEILVLLVIRVHVHWIVAAATIVEFGIDLNDKVV